MEAKTHHAEKRQCIRIQTARSGESRGKDNKKGKTEPENNEDKTEQEKASR